MDKPSFPTVFPNLQYKNCLTAIQWLEEVLGFTKHMVAMKDEKIVMHCEMKFGYGLIMISSTDENGLNWQGETPGKVDVALTAQDKAHVDTLYNEVKRHNATIVKDIQTNDFGEYGGSYGFTCADLEGNRWSIGTYQPFDHS